MNALAKRKIETPAYVVPKLDGLKSVRGGLGNHHGRSLAVEAVARYLSNPFENFTSQFSKNGTKQFHEYVVENGNLYMLRVQTKSHVMINTKEKYELLFSLLASGDLELIDPEDQKKVWEARKTNARLEISYRRRLKTICATVLNGIVVGNSSSIQLGPGANILNPYAGREMHVQQALAAVVPMIPFFVVDQTGAGLADINIIERGPEERLRVINRVGAEEPRHFTGAMLFEVGGKHYLFDLDRGDLSQRVWNPFMSVLPRKVNSIKEAYDSLMPDEVREAVAKGIGVKRQGEWFFIPVRTKTKAIMGRLTLQSKGNRPHYASTTDGKLVSGSITHGGHEHPALYLHGWFKPVSNGAVESFTIHGDVD